MRRRKRTAALTGLAAACSVAIVVAATGSAWSNDGPDLSNVATANTKSVGYAPASKLSPELAQIVGGAGLDEAREPERARSRYYGYDNDVAQRGRRAADGPHRRRARPRRTKTEPDKNTYLVFKHGLHGADPNYDYGTHFLFQGHEASACASGLHHAHQPRRRRCAPRDAAGDQGRERRPDRDDRRLDLGPVRPAAALHDGERRRRRRYAATPGYPSTVEDVSGALGRGGYEGIQNDSDGNIWIVEDIGGSNKPGDDGEAARTASSTATSRSTRATCTTGSCRCCRC